MSGLLADNAPNSPFTDSACCLWPVTCNQPSKVIILINDNITREYQLKKMTRLPENQLKKNDKITRVPAEKISLILLL